MKDLQDRLNQSRSGRAVLFCGAGFTADCLNFEGNSNLGTGEQLLNLLNSKLDEAGEPSGYRDLKNAADKCEGIIGEHGMMNALKDRYHVKNTSADMTQILQYPWSRIYTTNYDNGIEASLSVIQRNFIPLNNLDSPREIADKLEVVHLHGFAEKWEIGTFKQSCVLGAESYLRLPGVTDWIKHFRRDIERADLVCFIGFNAADFHLNQAIYDISGLREKIFFINRPAASPDPDLVATQERFGQSVFIGRSGLANSIEKILQSDAPVEPSLASFMAYEPPAAADSLPSVKEIEQLFIFGKFNSAQMARDYAVGKSDYHIVRPAIRNIVNEINSGNNIVFLVGEICDGKTIISEGLCLELSKSRRVYTIKHIYNDLLDEVSKILSVHTNAVFVIENCFDFKEERLFALARLCEGSSSCLILTSRNIAAEAEAPQISRLEKLTGFKKIRTEVLGEVEVSALVELVDQFAGWRSLDAVTEQRKRSFIERDCSGSLPNFLLRLLKSEYVKDRYLEEYNKISKYSSQDQTAIIAALYIAHVGHVAPVDFLSNALLYDVGSALDRLVSADEPFQLVHRDGGAVRAVPAIGASNILEHMVRDADIVDSVVCILEYLAELHGRDDFEQFIYGQMMRYSILRSVVAKNEEIERFFDNISKNGYFRTQVLFWLQWHMAKSDLNKFVDAENFLEQSFIEAKNYEKRTGKHYNLRQLNDRKAKFLMKRARYVERDSGALYRDFRESCDIVNLLLMEVETTHHVYNTLKEVCLTYDVLATKLSNVQAETCRKWILNLQKLAEQKLFRVAEGYQRSRATEYLRESRELVKE